MRSIHFCFVFGINFPFLNGNGVLSLNYVVTRKMVIFIQMVNDSTVHRNTNFHMVKSRRRKGERLL
jgi:hypothetical protein